MIAWLIEAVVASTLLMLVVLLVRAPVRKAFGADVAYALWLLPVLRLALPPLPPQWHAPMAVPVVRVAEQMTVLLVEPAAVTAAAAPSHAWLVPLLAGVWIVGAAAFVVWHTLAHHRFCRRLLDHTASREQRDGVQVIETSAATGPLAFGIWRRYVAFPCDFAERYEPDERDLALAHELGHHARGDLIANWIALGVLALHWFNPVAWRAFRAFRADQEIANDARVLAGMNPMRRHTYACAILKAAHPTFLGTTVSATCHLHTIDDLKGRLRMLTTTRTSRARLIGGGVAIAGLTLGGLGLTASGSQAAERVRASVKHATGVDIAALVPPTPPVAETAPVIVRDLPAQGHPRAITPDAPPVPEAPETSAVVADAAGAAVPPVPPQVPHDPRPPEGTVVVAEANDGKRVVRYGRYVKLDRHGDATLVGEIPPVSIVSRDCGEGGPEARTVITAQRDDGPHVIICADRVAAIAARGAVIAANSKDMERDAYAHALEGLRASRARMMTAQDMSDAARKAALAGIDTAIAELEQGLAKAR